MHRLLMLLVVLFYASAVTAGDKIYKWTDDEGNVHFGSKPPAAAEAEKVTVKTHDPGDAASKDLERIKKENEKAQKARKEKAAEQAKQAADEATKRERCARARTQLANLQSATRVYDTDDAGNRVHIDQEKREEAMKKVQEVIDKSCS